MLFCDAAARARRAFLALAACRRRRPRSWPPWLRARAATAPAWPRCCLRRRLLPRLLLVPACRVVGVGGWGWDGGGASVIRKGDDDDANDDDSARPQPCQSFAAPRPIGGPRAPAFPGTITWELMPVRGSGPWSVAWGRSGGRHTPTEAAKKAHSRQGRTHFLFFRGRRPKRGSERSRLARCWDERSGKPPRPHAMHSNRTVDRLSSATHQYSTGVASGRGVVGSGPDRRTLHTFRWVVGVQACMCAYRRKVSQQPEAQAASKCGPGASSGHGA